MKKRFATLLAMAVAVSALVAPGTASASTTEAVANTGGMTLTLGVLGAPITTVSVTLDEIGHITEVAIDDPAFTEDRADEHKVRFTNEDDTTRIEVKAKKDKLKAEVKAADLSAILGSHTWTGKLFGSDTDSSVAFDVIENASGYPELADVKVTSLFPLDAISAVGAIENKLEDDEAESEVKITFTWNGYTMTLKIEAEMEFDDDDVKLKVELKGKDEQKLREQAIADLVGPHTWDGRLCDGTALAVNYTVSDSGDVTVDSIDGVDADAYELKTNSHGFEVKFDDSKAEVKVELKQKDDGLWELKVKSKTTEKCDNGHNDDDGDDGDHKDKKHDDDDGEDNHDDDDDDDNNKDDHEDEDDHDHDDDDDDDDKDED